MSRTSSTAPAALLSQADELVRWVGPLGATDLDLPSVLPGWDIRTLVGHLVVVLEGCLEVLSRPSRERPVPGFELVRRYAPAAEEIDARARTTAATGRLAERLAASAGRLATALAVPLPRVVTSARGPILAGEFIATRVIEAAVHTDDIDRSVAAVSAEIGAPALERVALASATRTLAAMLADQHPGRSIEVRIPPFAAVQCGLPADPGPSHTRGTPPNVVETDPLTFLRLATGRTTWTAARAESRVRASGVRADLDPILPVLS